MTTSMLPEAPARRPLPRPSPTRCPDCMRRVRKPRELAAQWPGTVAFADPEGRCAPCKRARQTALIEADRVRLAEDQAAALVEAEERDRLAAEEAWRAAAEAVERDRLEAEAAARAEAEKRIVPTLDAPTAAMVDQLEPERSAGRRRQDPMGTCVHEGCTTNVAVYSKSQRCGRHQSIKPRPVKEMPGSDGLTPGERQAQRALEAYWAERRRRGVPPEGIGHGLAATG